MQTPWTCFVKCCVVLATTALLILSLQTKGSEAGLMHICDFNQRRPHPNGICGRRLPLVLAGLCHRFTMLMRNSGSAKTTRKRSAAASASDMELSNDLLQDKEDQMQLLAPIIKDMTPGDEAATGPTKDQLESIFLDKKSALGYLAKRDDSGDIVCECCYHQCSVLELLQYCELPANL
ncbi:insulin [Elysia marginata]|uniref:Insulin n=1 Tax=Elysia marginata TaxID=1093978 RepID=A0AAV4GP44_9GAST|nr:insulin [Elysia marginata]